MSAPYTVFHPPSPARKFLLIHLFGIPNILLRLSFAGKVLTMSERSYAISASLFESNGQTLLEGNTKPQPSWMASDFPLACTTLLLASINVLFPLPGLGVVFALGAFLLSLLQITFLIRKVDRISHVGMVLLFIFTAFFLVTSRMVALNNKGATRAQIGQIVLKPTPKKPSPIPSLTSPDQGTLMPSKLNSAATVNALRAVELSQLAHPHSGDVDTEAKENVLDETRIISTVERPLAQEPKRPPNLKGTFIINTHRGESW